MNYEEGEIIEERGPKSKSKGTDYRVRSEASKGEDYRVYAEPLKKKKRRRDKILTNGDLQMPNH